MSFEIERKFLVCRDDWRELATSRVSIRQSYLTSDGKASARVRIKGDGTATLTIKSRDACLQRLELEYAIPILDAEALMQLRQGCVVEKERYVVPQSGLAWEIDVFSGENVGLIIAEIELLYEHQQIGVPRWIGAEVTGQARYYNISLAQRPFCSWPQQDRPMPVEKLASTSSNADRGATGRASSTFIGDDEAEAGANSNGDQGRPSAELQS